MFTTHIFNQQIHAHVESQQLSASCPLTIQLL